ncbi:MAG: hypothetical protein KC561_10540 [Myxococcales bacterium]|nr:hypothetical protein [Myxococcales bacterium]
MPRLPRSLVAALTLLVLFASANANATVLMHQTVEDLAAQSDLVVIGTVEGQWPEWDAENQRLVTLTAFRIDQIVATSGEVREGEGQRIVIEQEGGFLPEENWGVHVAGNASLALGEHALLFLRRSEAPAERYFIYGMELGKFHIEEGTTPILHRSSTVPVVLMGLEGTPTMLEQSPSPYEGRPLDELLGDIENVGGAR